MEVETRNRNNCSGLYSLASLFLTIKLICSTFTQTSLEFRWSPSKLSTWSPCELQVEFRQSPPRMKFQGEWSGVEWSLWTPSGFHGIHLDSTQNPGGIWQDFGWLLCKVNSIWNPPGVEVSIWIPCGSTRNLWERVSPLYLLLCFACWATNQYKKECQHPSCCEAKIDVDKS